jgi:choline-sulfatase
VPADWHQYAGDYENQLFDLENDPHERVNLIHDPATAQVAIEMSAALRSICDPEVVNAQAFNDQAAIIEKAGGEQAIRRRGFVTPMPVPDDVRGDFDDGAASAGKIIDPHNQVGTA